MSDFPEIFALILIILSILFLHFRILRKQGPPTNRARIYLLDGIALIIVLLGAFSPESYLALMEEDYIGEWATFYAFLLSAFIIVIHLWFSRKDGLKFFSLSFLVPLTVAAFCLAVAGEEASWGQRILAFKPPDIFLEKNYQQELNVHNLFKGDGLWGIAIESKHLVMLIAFFYGVLFPLFTRFVPPFKKLNKFAPNLYLMPYFIMVIAMEEIYPISLTGEGCELYLGAIFLVHVFDTYPPGDLEIHKWNKWYKLSTLTASVFILGIITAPLLNFVIYGPNKKAEAATKEELQLLQNDFLNPGAKKKKILGHKWFHKRIYTAIAQNYFYLPEDSLFLEANGTPACPGNDEVRHDRKGYFLDPWNNPYWVCYYRKRKFVMFYSFGPNRKRDSNLRKGLRLKGDDIGAIFYIKIKGQDESQSQ